MKNDFAKGMRHGIPIMLGYLSVSFGFGILASKSGMPVWAAVLTSVLNVTSAGQASGVITIAACSTLIETVIQLILTQFVINVRYSLMAISLSQRLDGSFKSGHRFAAAYGITDEIFAVAYSQSEAITPYYMYGLISVSAFGWTLGTLLGALSGQLLPLFVTNAMGILLYGMFIAIVIPPMKKHRGIAFAVLLSIALSSLLYYLLPVIPSGIAVIISALISAVAAALLFPSEEVAQ